MDEWWVDKFRWVGEWMGGLADIKWMGGCLYERVIGG